MFDVGVTLGDRYLLASLVARGGMGEVWSARDVVLDRRVAVKVLLPNLAGDPDFAARFRAEARAMAALSHPGIIEIYDYGQADGLAYLVMQFVEGESLVSLIRRSGPLPPQRAMRLVIQAAEAIEGAHRQGIVHRDVKPANLLLRADGRLALTDFGIARILATDRLTGADQIVGTSSYLAPEQVTGEEIGPATDVYALGVVAHELLTGAKPFTADTPFGVALKHVHEEPPPLPDEVPQRIREVVRRAMAKDPADRWPTAAALAQAASAALAQATSAGIGETQTPAAPPQFTGEPTGEATRTTRRSATVSWDAPQPGSRRLVLAGGAVVAALTTAAVLIVVLSPNGVGNPQSEGTSVSPSAAAPSSAGPAAVMATGTGTPTPVTRTGGPGTSQPASPARQSTGAAKSSPLPATVPNMYGWKENEAVSELRRLGLVEQINYRWTPDKCYVVDQWPPGGTVLARGASVRIEIARATGNCKEV